MSLRKSLLVFIFLGAIGVRLIALEQPFVDNWSWRQSDVAAIARNFFTGGFRFAHPQIDWAGNSGGYVGTEFPVLPFAAALCYRGLGVQEWIGRLQGVLFLAASLPFFYLLVRELAGRTVGIWALTFYSFAPLTIVASRAFMPDIPSLSLALISLYCFILWLERERRGALLASALLLALSILIKLPTAIVGAPLFYLVVRRFGWSGLRRPALWLFAAIVLLPSALWYWHAHQIAEKFYPYHFFGGGGLRIMGPAWYGRIAWQTATSTLTPLMLLLALAGAFRLTNEKYGRVFHVWLGAMVAFIFFVGWGNRHQWYQLPLVPIAAVFAGQACAAGGRALSAKRWPRIAVAAALLLLFGGLAFFYARPFYAPVATELRDAGLKVKMATAPDALVVAADNGDPTIFYYAERKGWHFTELDGIYNGEPADSAQAIRDLDNLRSRGAGYFVVTSGTRWWLDYYADFAEHLARSASVLEANDHFVIYRLNPTP